MRECHSACASVVLDDGRACATVDLGKGAPLNTRLDDDDLYHRCLWPKTPNTIFVQVIYVNLRLIIGVLLENTVIYNKL